jgi:molybdopterin-guanine dinucleotide biosynthesis protein A
MGGVMPEINAAVLAGGESRRFGQDKSTLNFGDTNLLERIYHELTSVVKSCCIIGRKQKGINIHDELFTDDIVTNVGPIGGLHTALNISNIPILLTSCDMPFLKKNHIQFLIDQFDSSMAATIAVSEKGIEPLFGIYQHEVLPIIDRFIANNEFALYRLFDHLQVKFVDFAKAGYISDLFFNINTLSDYKKALYLRNEFESKNSIKDFGGENG